MRYFYWNRPAHPLASSRDRA